MAQPGTPMGAIPEPKAAAAPTGCCTITMPDGTGYQFPGITHTECDVKAAILNGASYWVEGNCG